MGSSPRALRASSQVLCSQDSLSERASRDTCILGSAAPGEDNPNTICQTLSCPVRGSDCHIPPHFVPSLLSNVPSLTLHLFSGFFPGADEPPGRGNRYLGSPAPFSNTFVLSVPQALSRKYLSRDSDTLSFHGFQTPEMHQS